ncbi:MAG: GIY-YIG nuclease family protein [Candidatus Peribacter sp.]
MPYYFYLAQCCDYSLYAGSCINVKAREAKHNEGTGAKYTRSRRPIQIVYFEEFQTLTEARRRERQVKTWSKAKKERLARGKPPTK